jgi:uncharacterized membrane protein
VINQVLDSKIATRITRCVSPALKYLEPKVVLAMTALRRITDASVVVTKKPSFEHVSFWTLILGA